MTSTDTSTLCLFDVDGTLTKPRQIITTDMKEFLKELSKKVHVAVVGGSDLVKILEQLGGESAFNDFEFLFSENGLVTHKHGKPLDSTDIVSYLGEEKLQDIINFILGYLSQIKLPCKRGTFIEFRKGMLNISPIGRSCSQVERDAFFEYDKVHKIRETMVTALRERYGSDIFHFSIGGQISMDIFPVGWHKCFCLKYLEQYKTIHFFGDKTLEGGNDYEIFIDPRTIGHSVRSPEDTKNILTEMFFS